MSDIADHFGLLRVESVEIGPPHRERQDQPDAWHGKPFLSDPTRAVTVKFVVDDMGLERLVRLIREADKAQADILKKASGS